MVPKKAKANCSIVRLAKRRDGFGERSLADLANLPHTGRRPPCLMEPNAFTKNLSRTVQKDAKGISPPELHRNYGQCGHMKV